MMMPKMKVYLRTVFEGISDEGLLNDGDTGWIPAFAGMTDAENEAEEVEEPRTQPSASQLGGQAEEDVDISDEGLIMDGDTGWIPAFARMTGVAVGVLVGVGVGVFIGVGVGVLVGFKV